MSSNIKIKRSEVAGNPGTLGAGELAYSSYNGLGGNRLYIGTGTEIDGDAVNHAVIGGKFFTDMITAATASNTADTLILRDLSGDFSGNVINAASFVGPLTGNASTATSWATARDLGLTGDGTATLSNVNGTGNVSAVFTLKTVNSNVGDFGSATSIPIVTVNAKGLVTAVSTAAVAGSLNVAGGTGTDSIALLTDTLTFEGGTGVATTVTNNKVSFAIGQAVSPTSNVTFNDITVAGKLESNDITSTNISIAGNATITGNLTVQGTTTTIDSTTLAVGDINIVLAKDATTAFGANGGGLTIVGPETAATLTYTSADNRWNFNKDLNVPNVYGALKGNADTATKWATARNLSLTGDAAATLTSVDGSDNVTAALILATVNENIGTYNNVTVNAKGLAIAASNVAYYHSGNVPPYPAETDTLATVTARGAITTTASTFNGGITVKDSISASTTNPGGNFSLLSNLTGSQSLTIAGGVLTTGTDKYVYIGTGTGNHATSTTTVEIGSGTSGSLTKVYSPLQVIGNVTGTNLSGTNTGDNAVNSLYSGLVSNATHTGDATGSTALTLATVNSNVGSFGNSTTVPSFTVNAKGLVTAASSTAIPNATYTTTGLASFDTDQFTITAGAVSLKAVDGGTYE